MPKQPATLGAALVDRDLARHFAQRAATYDLAPWVRDPRIMATTIDFIDPRPGQKIVDVGAGTGAVLEAVLATALTEPPARHLGDLTLKSDSVSTAIMLSLGRIKVERLPEGGP